MADKHPAPSATASGAVDDKLELKKRARRRLVGATALALGAVIVLPMVMDHEPKTLSQDIQIRIPSQDTGANSVVSRIAPKALPTPLPAEAKPAAAKDAKDVKDTKAEPKPEAKAETKPETKSEAKAEPKAEPKALAKSEARPEAAKPAAKPEAKPEPKPEAKPAAKPVEKPAEKPATKPAEKSTDKTASKAAESARAAALLNDAHWIVQLGAYQDQANVKSLQAKIKELGYATFTEKVDTAGGTRIRVRCGPFPSKEAAEKAQARLKKIGAGGPGGGTVAQAK